MGGIVRVNFTCGGNIKLFTGNANIDLAREISREIGIRLGDANVTRFADGEIGVHFNEPVRGCDVFIIQPTCPPINENLMELLIMIDASRRASAGRITAVMPYYGYARQDRKAKARDPITAKLVADILTTSGADRVVSMDLHCDQLQGFFNIPVDHLKGVRILSNYYNAKFADKSNLVVVSPDLGSVGRARQFAERLDVPLAIVDKRRPRANMSEVMNVIGMVDGKSAILLDDMIDTGGSIVHAAAAIKEHGALDVLACCTHGLFTRNAVELIDQSPILELVTLNTIPLPENKMIPKIKTLSVAPLFASAIDRIHSGSSISRLFD
jgi:ribose-phosphate pyrophosphokinase